MRPEDRLPVRGRTLHWKPANKVEMRFVPICFAVLIALAATQVANTQQNSPLESILNRYGGEQKLAEFELQFKEGRRCGDLGPCQDFRYFRKGPSKLRLEEGFDPPLWTVKIIRENVAQEYFTGPWWNRSLAWATGLKDGPLDRIDIAAMRLDTPQLVFDFLRAAKSSNVTYEGKTLTMDGRPADSFMQPWPERNATVRYLFDPESHLCLQRTITPTGSKHSPYIIYSDYREASGLPYPFRTEMWLGKLRIQNETLQSVKIGAPPDEKLFTERPNDPLWVFALVALGAATIVFTVVIWGLHRG